MSSSLPSTTFEQSCGTGSLVLDEQLPFDLCLPDPIGSVRVGEPRIGKGGFGLVFKAYGKLGKPVAVKIVDVKNPKMHDITLKEIAKLSSISHRNIVKFYGSEVFQGRACIAMEFGEVTLAKLKQDRGIVRDNLDLYVKQVLLALQYLHEEKLTVHRDVKPANVVLFPETQHVKLIDFGFSATIGDPFPPKGVTLAYVAPEIARSNEPHPLHDIWAVAVMALELYHGDIPYYHNCSDEAAFCQRIAVADVEKMLPPEVVVTTLPLKDFLWRCFQSFEKRPTCRELLETHFIKKSCNMAASSSVAPDLAPERASKTPLETPKPRSVSIGEIIPSKYYCGVCDKDCTNEFNFKVHCIAEKHIKKCQSDAFAKRDGFVSWLCPVCDKDCQSEPNFRSHCLSHSHQRKCQLTSQPQPTTSSNSNALSLIPTSAVSSSLRLKNEADVARPKASTSITTASFSTVSSSSSRFSTYEQFKPTPNEGRDAKTLLNVLCQRKNFPAPEYTDTFSGPDHERIWHSTVRVLVRNSWSSSSTLERTGLAKKTKIEAQQSAAEAMLGECESFFHLRTWY